MWISNALGLIFYHQILGLPAGLAGTALTLAIFADAITDPLIGAVSDRFRSRFGRRHPFLFTAPIPQAICVFLIFHPPQFVVESHALLFSWLCVFTILQRTFQTFYVVPHLAMGAELYTDQLERTRVMAFNYLFGLCGNMIMQVPAWFVVFWLHFRGSRWATLSACLHVGGSKRLRDYFDFQFCLRFWYARSNRTSQTQREYPVGQNIIARVLS